MQNTSPPLSLTHKHASLPPPCPTEQLLAECAPKGAHTEPAPKVNRAGETRGRCRYCCWRWPGVFSAWQVPPPPGLSAVSLSHPASGVAGATAGIQRIVNSWALSEAASLFPPREEVAVKKKSEEPPYPGLYGISSLPSSLKRFPAFFFLPSSASGGTGTLPSFLPPPRLPPFRKTRRRAGGGNGVKG